MILLSLKLPKMNKDNRLQLLPMHTTTSLYTLCKNTPQLEFAQQLGQRCAHIDYQPKELALSVGLIGMFSFFIRPAEVSTGGSVQADYR